ncbi:MAG: Fe-S protein assembly co-chaperone HscB [Lewinellaceae bacterium]|nr:Fe-S protein assembly co-chaperone HscB [Saprospiraceae bacterium]MCB9339955.1 Fe-S protein assembly co-chaperone HscB [Lewinellaceae bacterium]
MDYFEFFEIPVSFHLDNADLKQRFLQKSRQFHPDFFTLAGEEKQAEVLELSTLNNEAYRTLSDPDKRMGYILQHLGLIAEEGKNEVPQDFLMDMMDLNEALMELEFGFDESVFEKAKNDLAQIEMALSNEVAPYLERFDANKPNLAELETIKDFYFKKRYLWRIQENLDRFAPVSKET